MQHFIENLNTNNNFDHLKMLQIYFSRVDGQPIAPSHSDEDKYFEMELSQLRDSISKKFLNDPLISKILDFNP